MAAWTATATDTVNPPRKYHGGETVARAQYVHNGATSFSASDIIFMCRIPHGVYINDGYISGVVPSDATVFKIGISGGGGAESTLNAAATLSATSQMVRFNGGGLPFKISLSDSATQRFVWLYLTRTSGTATATASIQVVVKYSAIGAE